MLAEGKISADEAERLIAAMEASPALSAHAVAGSLAGKPRPKYLRVVVDSEDDGGHEGPTKVNVRVPMQLLRAGVCLAAPAIDIFHDRKPACDSASTRADCALQELRWKNHQRAPVDAVQSEARWFEPRPGHSSWWPHGAASGLLESRSAGAGLARIYLYRAQSSRVYRLWVGVSKGQFSRPRRWGL